MSIVGAGYIAYIDDCGAVEKASGERVDGDVGTPRG